MTNSVRNILRTLQVTNPHAAISKPTHGRVKESVPTLEDVHVLSRVYFLSICSVQTFWGKTFLNPAGSRRTSPKHIHGDLKSLAQQNLTTHVAFPLTKSFVTKPYSNSRNNFGFRWKTAILVGNNRKLISSRSE